MAALTASAASDLSRRQAATFPASSARFEWAFAALTLWVVGGLYLDGWAHSHDRVDNTFFTPWHALLYSGVALIAAFLFVNQWRGMDKGYPLTRALPAGYRWSLVGAGLFLFGGGLDLIWHTLFGFEVGLETLLSPTHLLLATSGILMVTGPLRSAFARLRAGTGYGWRELGPVVVAALAILSILTFFTSFAHPITDYYAAAQPGADVDQYSDLYLMNLDGTGQTRLTNTPGQLAWGGSWSPDGRRIVYTAGDPSSDDSNLYVANADGSGAALLADIPGAEYRVNWSPDGQHIAFISDRDGKSDIGVVDADGSDFHLVTDTDSREYGPIWSPDGQRIVFTSNRDGDDHLYVTDADGANVRRLTFDGQYNNGATWSPDGKQILFSSYRDGSTNLYLMDADGSHLVRLTYGPNADQWPSFSADGSKILFETWRDDTSDIMALDAACITQPTACDATAVNLTHNHALHYLFPQTSPDGSKILLTGRGNPARLPSFYSGALGLAAVLIQSFVLMGLVLLLVKRWSLPPGALTLLIGLNGAAMTVFNDHEALIPFIFAAALLADVLLWLLKPSPEKRVRFYGFAFLTPALIYVAYYAAIQFSSGIGWTIHLWLGSIFMAGIVGLFVGFLLLNPLTPSDQPLTSER